MIATQVLSDDELFAALLKLFCILGLFLDVIAVVGMD
jgi:hypothetical protein